MISKEIATAILRSQRVSDSLESAGLTVKFVKHLDRMTNVETVWGGHLKNATLHYVNRWEIGGNTYQLREQLTRWGFRWDSGAKVWHIAPKRKRDKISIGSALLNCLNNDGQYVG